MRLDDLVLDLVCSFFFVFFLSGAAVFVPLLRFNFDADDLLLGQLAFLLKGGCIVTKSLLEQNWNGTCKDLPLEVWI